MSSAARKAIFVVAGVGNGTGTGAVSALANAAKDIQAQGGEAAAFPIKAYTHADVKSGFDEIKKYWPNGEIRVALWNAVFFVLKGVLELTEQEVEESIQTNIIGAFAFARQALLAFQDLELNDKGKRGSLLFTSATAAWRRNKLSSAFAYGKTGQRALAQSLNKEFGPKSIHVSNVIVDEVILTDRTSTFDAFKPLLEDENKRVSPERIANSYMYLVN
ncbi:NAD-P-binding protein [Rhizoctonia solani]|nr:NAD-P-binding protein [Rhizoctonia solani]